MLTLAGNCGTGVVAAPARSLSPVALLLRGYPAAIRRVVLLYRHPRRSHVDGTAGIHCGKWRSASAMEGERPRGGWKLSSE